MPRIARVVIPGLPHHIVQRGNRNQKVFFNDNDRQTYLNYLIKYAKPAGIGFWGYCLMDNHVHIIAVPKDEGSLTCGFSEAHCRYTRMINFRQKWRGHLWEGRFKSYPLSQPYLYAAMRYIERNPVRAGVVKTPWDYPWSSAKAHTLKQDDPLLDDNFLTAEMSDWKTFLLQDDIQEEARRLKKHTSTGRPLGDACFIKLFETRTGRTLHKQKPGPKVRYLE